jgi:hypothetical protein
MESDGAPRQEAKRAYVETSNADCRGWHVTMDRVGS